MASPQTIIRDGGGAQTASYQLPPGLFQYIESVLVQIDNTGGGDIRPTLQVQTVNGVVMAAKRQGETIPAGDTGTATWALRLTDEGGGATTAVQQERFLKTVPQIGAASAVTTLTWEHRDGDNLLDLTVPTAPVVIAAGTYAFTMTMEISRNVAALTGGSLFNASLVALPNFTVDAAVAQLEWSAIAVQNADVTATLVSTLPAGTLVTFQASTNFVNSYKVVLLGNVVKLA